MTPQQALVYRELRQVLQAGIEAVHTYEHHWHWPPCRAALRDLYCAIHTVYSSQAYRHVKMDREAQSFLTALREAFRSDEIYHYDALKAAVTIVSSKVIAQESGMVIVLAQAKQALLSEETKQ